VVLHGAFALGSFALGAKLLREHRSRWVLLLAGGSIALLVLGGILTHQRLGVVATYLQFRGGFGTRSIWHTSVLGTTLALGSVWIAGAGHLLWSLARRL
jgi:hypothetical protein